MSIFPFPVTNQSTNFVGMLSLLFCNHINYAQFYMKWSFSCKTKVVDFTWGIIILASTVYAHVKSSLVKHY